MRTYLFGIRRHSCYHFAAYIIIQNKVADMGAYETDIKPRGSAIVIR